MHLLSLLSRAPRSLVALSIVALATLTFAGPAAANSQPTLIRDINLAGGSNPTNMTVVGGTLFFAANDGVNGTELWKSDGTVAGTKMVKNIRPYGKSSLPQNLVNVNGMLFFTANDGPHGRELWKSNGTRAGTVMVKDIHPGKANQFGGNSLNVHDRLMPIGSKVYFFDDVCCVGTSQLWVSNGTALGTHRVTDRWFDLPETGSAVVQGTRIFFAAGEWSGEDFYMKAWVSNGTRAGTHRVSGSPSAYEINYLPVSGQTSAYFTTSDEDAGNVAIDRLWKTDGTASGTVALTTAGELSAAPTEAAYLAKRLYFNDGALWKTDGTAAGTNPFWNGQASDLTVMGGRLYWISGGEMWRTDGTTAGTANIFSFGPNDLHSLIAVGTELCFSVPYWGANDWDLWATNGTFAGTYMVASFQNPSANDGVREQAAMGGRLFFAADDGTHGVELWSYTP